MRKLVQWREWIFMTLIDKLIIITGIIVISHISSHCIYKIIKLKENGFIPLLL